MPDITPIQLPAVPQGTAYHLAKAFGSFATSRREVAGTLVGLAIVSALPGAAVPALAAGTALLGFHVAAVRGHVPKMPRSWDEVRTLFAKRPVEPWSATLATDSDGRPVTLDNDRLRQHLLVVGPPDARRDTLLSLCEQMTGQASGFLFCDGTGDVTTYAAVHDMVSRLSREDDLLVLNLMNGHGDDASLSHTLNPFASGSPEVLAQIVVGLMDEHGGDGAMWKARATAMLVGIMRALTWMRDEGRIELDVDVVRRHLDLRAIIDLTDPDGHPDMPPYVRESVRSYLTALPGYREERRHRQAQTTLDQHGYLEMQFTKILGSLADAYGQIFRTDTPDIDITDVVSNRRILVVLLPSLERSGEEVAILGKVVVATLKGLMGSALSNRIEGNWGEVIDKRLMFPRHPFMCALDEAGHYAVGGMALMAAEARALGFSMAYGTQDIPTMKRIDEKEASSIIANTNTKIFIGQDGSPEKFTAIQSDRVAHGRIDPPRHPRGRSMPKTNHFVAIRLPDIDK